MSVWVRFNANKQLEWLSNSGELTQGNWESLSQHSKEVFLVAPPEAVLLLTVTLPKKLKRQKLLKALPFLLEDQLSDEIETYHIALPDSLSTELVTAGVVSRASMDLWLHEASEHGINIAAIYPEPLLLPITDNSWTFAFIDQQSIVRTGLLTGFGTTTETLSIFLDSFPEQAQQTQVLNYTGHALSLPTLANPIVENRPTTQYLTDLAVTKSPIDLCQGEYRQRKKANQLRRYWIAAIALILLSILLGFINNLVIGLLSAHKNRLLDAQITTIYKKNFPNATSMVSPEVRMKEKLQTAESGSSGNVYLDIMAKVAYVARDISSIRLKHLQFSAETLTIDIETKKFQDVNILITHLQNEGLSVTQQNASSSDGITKATLVIKELG